MVAWSKAGLANILLSRKAFSTLSLLNSFNNTICLQITAFWLIKPPPLFDLCIYKCNPRASPCLLCGPPVGWSWPTLVSSVYCPLALRTVGSNPILKIDMCLFCICCVLCLGEPTRRVSPFTRRPAEGLQIDFETQKMRNFGLLWSVWG